jgi:predicted transposase/invertase (TIGR01784 family)
MAVAQTSPAIAEAWGAIKHLSADESARMVAESREKARMDMEAYRETGRREGLREGRQEEKLGVAENLLRMKMPVDDVAKATGLPLDEVRRLAAEFTA